MIKDLNKHLSEEDANGQHVYKKMLKITNHQANAYQNHNEISLNTHQDGHYCNKKRKRLVRLKRNWNPCTRWCEYKMVHSLWQTIWGLLKILKIELSYESAIPHLDIYPKDLKSGSQTDICTHMFIVALFLIAKMEKQPKCPLVG